MANTNKKIQKLQDRLTELETELRVALTKKTHDSAEIDVARQNRMIDDVRRQIRDLSK